MKVTKVMKVEKLRADSTKLPDSRVLRFMSVFHLNTQYSVINTKAKASTMIEALVAMVIILGAFVVTCMIYVNITTSDHNRQKLNAQLLISEMMIKTRQDKSYIDEKTETATLIIEKTVSKYPNAENLNQVNIKATNKEGKLIVEYKELMAAGI